MFPSEDAFIEHMVAEHENISMSDAKRQAKLAQHPSEKPFSCCPFCSDFPLSQRALQDHIAEELLNAFLLALPERDDEEGSDVESRSDKTVLSRNTTQDLAKMVSHPTSPFLTPPEERPHDSSEISTQPDVVDALWQAIWDSPALKKGIRQTYSGLNDELLLHLAKTNSNHRALFSQESRNDLSQMPDYSEHSWTTTGHGNSGLQVDQTFSAIHDNAPQLSDCHQMFRLTDEGSDGYEYYKDRIEKRVAGTCEWFLKHPKYVSWKERSLTTLLISADPGCGKSVLAKHLVDYELSGSVCYFFFNKTNQNTIKQALCAILHQLFTKNRSLLKYALVRYEENGAKLLGLTDILWGILREAISDPEAGSITLVLDALDECVSSDFDNFVYNLTDLYHITSTTGWPNVKFILTTRHYRYIIRRFLWFTPFHDEHIIGETCWPRIASEVELVIEYRITKLSERFKLSQEIAEHLRERLFAIVNRTYLWIHFIFNFLERGFWKTRKEIEECIDTIPENLCHAYEEILQRSTNPENARKVLSIILSAARPLSLKEIKSMVTIGLSQGATLTEDYDMGDDEDFGLNLRDWCGLLISISDQKVYFLHETVRAFLATNQSTTSIQSQQWQASINFQEGHLLLAKICATHIDLTATKSEVFSRKLTLFNYSAYYWTEHFRNARTYQTPELISLALRLCRVNDRHPPNWFQVYYKDTFSPSPTGLTTLMIISYLGLEELTSIVLTIKNVNDCDNNRRSALHFASLKGHEAIVRLLLEHGADTNIRDYYKRTALFEALQGGHETVARLLLNHGAETDNTKDHLGRSALHLASLQGYETIVRLLLNQDVETDTKDNSGWTALLEVSFLGHQAIVRLLLEHGAETNTKDHFGRSALHLASLKGYETIVRLLLDHGADTNIRDYSKRTALFEASLGGHETVVRLLLNHGAMTSNRDFLGRTALDEASSGGYQAIVQLLLDHGAQANTKDVSKQTALHLASSGGHQAIVRLLLDHGAETSTRDFLGRTALHLASSGGYQAIVRILHDHR